WAALVAAQHDAEVTLVEQDRLGGACVLYDCVPSKTFIASSGARTSLHGFGELGIETDLADTSVNLAAVHGRVRGLALAQSADIRARVQRAGVRLLTGFARFCDDEPGMAAPQVAVTGPEGAAVLGGDTV